MSEFTGRGYVMEGDSSRPLFKYRRVIRILYISVLSQASLCYVFFALGVLFSSNSFRNHLVGVYAFIFGLVSLVYHLSYSPMKDRVHLFLPKFEEDIVKHTFYFLLGLPGVTDSDSFQYRLGSILFTLVGFVGTLVSLRHQNLLNNYLSDDQPAYQEP